MQTAAPNIHNMPAFTERMPLHKVKTRMPLNSTAIASPPKGLIFSLKMIRANRAVRIGADAMTTLPVAAVSDLDAWLKVIIYSAKPKTPASRNLGKSFFPEIQFCKKFRLL